mgnify:CR=1 FL=1
MAARAGQAYADYVHGESGMDGADLPEPSRPPESDDAVGFIIETCRANEGVWLVPTGPLTNIALAMRAAPELPRLAPWEHQTIESRGRCGGIEDAADEEMLTADHAEIFGQEIAVEA